MKGSSVITKSTLVPISGIGIVSSLSFWMASIVGDVSANTYKIESVKNDRATFEAELVKQIVGRIDRHSELLSEMNARAAATDAKVSLLLKWSEDGKGK